MRTCNTTGAEKPPPHTQLSGVYTVGCIGSRRERYFALLTTPTITISGFAAIASVAMPNCLLSAAPSPTKRLTKASLTITGEGPVSFGSVGFRSSTA